MQWRVQRYAQVGFPPDFLCRADRKSPANPPLHIAPNRYLQFHKNTAKYKILKKIILFSLSFLILFSCVGSDTAFLPTSITEAKKENLLINIYKPSEKVVKIYNQEFLINEAFTTSKHMFKNDKRINENFFAFIFKLVNSKTGKEIEYQNDFDELKYINFYSENSGIIDSNLAIYYEDLTLKNKLDTIKIGFIDYKKNEKVILFIKQK